MGTNRKFVRGFEEMNTDLRRLVASEILHSEGVLRRRRDQGGGGHGAIRLRRTMGHTPEERRHSSRATRRRTQRGGSQGYTRGMRYHETWTQGGRTMHRGFDVQETREAPWLGAQRNSQLSKPCPTCDTSLPLAARYCTNCGGKVE